MNCTPFVIQYIILSNKWGAVQSGLSGIFNVSICAVGHIPDALFYRLVILFFPVSI